jgi:hypothetical protein
VPLPVIDPSAPLQYDYQRPVQELVQAIESGLGENLHSIYVYGSVARKCAVVGKSNLDLVIVTRRPPDARFQTLLGTIKWRFKKAFPFITDYSLQFPLVEEVLAIESIITWGFMLKHCCVCLSGDDLSTRYGEFEPSWEIAKFWNMDVGEWLEIYRKKIAKSASRQEQTEYQIIIAKKLLRASYSLIMHKDKGWYDDPVRCGEVFLDYHPDKQVEVERLNILLSGRYIPKRSSIGLLDSYGDWLMKAYKKTEFKIG